MSYYILLFLVCFVGIGYAQSNKIPTSSTPQKVRLNTAVLFPSVPSIEWKMDSVQMQSSIQACACITPKVPLENIRFYVNGDEKNPVPLLASDQPASSCPGGMWYTRKLLITTTGQTTLRLEARNEGGAAVSHWVLTPAN